MSDDGPDHPQGRLLKRARENPVVPIGILGALGAIGYAVHNYKNRTHERMSVYVVQLRVVAQGIVVGALALTAGSTLYHRLMDDNKKK